MTRPGPNMATVLIELRRVTQRATTPNRAGTCHVVNASPCEVTRALAAGRAGVPLWWRCGHLRRLDVRFRPRTRPVDISPRRHRRSPGLPSYPLIGVLGPGDRRSRFHAAAGRQWPSSGPTALAVRV